MHRHHESKARGGGSPQTQCGPGTASRRANCRVARSPGESLATRAHGDARTTDGHGQHENAQKIFDVTPSEYITRYVMANITNPYIKSQVNTALALKIHDEEIKIESQKPEEVSEDRLCPTCKNNLVFVEGCSICIECGYSGCTSG